MYCSECGKKNPDTAKFCAFCGAKLLEEENILQADTAPDWEAESRFDAPDVPERNVWAKPTEEAPVPEIVEEPAPKAKPARRWGEEEIVRADRLRVEVSPWAKPEDTREARRAAQQGSPSTIVPVPGSRREATQDLFFDSYDTPAPARRAPAPRRRKQKKPSFLEKNLRGILGIGLTLGTLLILAAWLYLMPSGQQMLARFGMTSNPRAYAAIAQNAYNAQNYSTAAANYYQALVLDDDNYEYAIRTADCYEKAGQKGAASTALTMAIEINASDARAYRMLQALYPDAATRPAAVSSLLQQGATLTGDASLTN